MSIIAVGRSLSLIVFLVTFFVVCYSLWLNSRGREAKLRSMVQLQAIEDGVSRSIETGRPVFYHLDGDITSPDVSQMIFAGLNVLRHTAYVCANRGAEFVPFVANAALTPFADGMVREACVAAGKPEAYRQVIFREYAEGSVEMEEYNRRGVGMVVAIGAFYGNHAAVLSEAHRQGGLVVAGTARYFLQGSVAMHADYPAFMEDVFALAAITSGENAARWTLIVSDVLKIVLIGLLLTTVALGLANLPIMSWLAR